MLHSAHTNKRALLCFVAVLLALPPGAIAQAPNQILDPSLESGAESWHGLDFRRVADPEFVRNGNHGLEVVTDSTKPQDGVHYASTWKWAVDGETLRSEGKGPHTASVSVKGVRNYQGVTLRLIVYAEKKVALGQVTIPLTGEWQRMTCPFSTREDTDYFGISILKDGGEGSDVAAVFALDDLVVRRASGDTTQEEPGDLTEAEKDDIAARAAEETERLQQDQAQAARRDRIEVLLALVAGAVIIAMTAIAPSWVLLLLLLIREALALLPELTIAGVSIGIDGIITYAVTAGFLIAIPFRSRELLRKPYVWIALAFVGICTLSLLQSSSPLFGFRQCFRFLTYIVFFWIAYTAATEAYAKRMVKVGIFIAITLLGLGAIQWAQDFGGSWGDYVRSMSDHKLNWRLSGFREFPHTYANMFLAVMPILYWVARSAQSKAKAALAYGLLGLSGLAILAAGARTEMLALGVGSVVLLIALRQYKTVILIPVLFLIAGFGTGVFQARIDIFLNPERSGELNSWEERQFEWAIIDEAIRERPILGHGIGSVEDFLRDSPKSRGQWKPAHQDYRKFLFEAGLPGLALYIAMMLAITYACWRRRGTEKNLAQHLAAGTAATGCAWLTIALFDEIYQDWYPLTLWWVLAGLALGLANQQMNITTEAQRTQRNIT